jgi:N-acetylmuramoyl-L-alanine amidase|tara:strand:- start:7449 stop:7877 length:429 start_codon:yes stop_codon:yes gene_type:complete
MKRKIDKIIVHCSATRPSHDIDAKEIDRWHKKRGWSGIGYHFFIKRGGLIEIGRPIEKQGAHTKGLNKNSIGICYAGGVKEERGEDGKWDADDNRTSEQIASLLTLLRLLKKIFPEATIHGHREFAAKSCPCFDAAKEYKGL